MQSLLFCLASQVSLCVWAFAGTASLTIDFDSGNSAATFATNPGPGVSLSPRGPGNQALAVAPDEEHVDLNAMPITPLEKLVISFSARVESDFTVETNDRAHIEALRESRGGTPLAGSYQLLFFDEEDQEIKSKRGGEGGLILTKGWQNYVHVFWSPPDARSMRLRLRPNGQTLFADDISLRPETEEGSINPNPDFRYGELSYSGWQPQRDGRLYARPDGKTVLNPGHGGGSPFFPWQEGVTYRVSARGVGSEAGVVNVQHLGIDGEVIVTRFLLRPAPDGNTVDVTPPPGTRAGRFVMYGGPILEELRVARID